ncbi:MAG: asparagine synthase (glutamine-hydrolyzing) [Deltaproteobacteria bacterium]|nr:asparagine synthase (glutamine-hydrolyzing) [Deltaproteobacteria bacterium]
MCGIAGYLARDRSPEDTRGLVQRMTDAESHRGPDAGAIYQDGPIVFGHRRLAIIDLSADANQPMVSADGDVVLTFNGEIYNYLELAADLRTSGVTLRTKSDTEVLLELYRRDGLGAFAKLSGMYAFAIWDRRKRRLVLVRDRLGKKPLFFHLGPRGIAFASELQALLQDREIARTVEPRALHGYLALGYVPGDSCIIAGVRKVQPGHYVVLDDNGVREERYWQLTFAPRERPMAEMIEETRHLLFEAVRKRLMSDVPLGAFLSGGIDSSAVVAIMTKIGAKPVKTFSIGFEEKDYSELDFAREIAQKFETEHHEEVLRPNGVELLPQLVKAYGEPFADPSAVPTFLLSKMTRQHVTVALSGDGGDEAFGGYNRYVHEKIAMLVQRLPRKVLEPLAKFVEDKLPGRKAGPLGELAAAIRTHARRIQMDAVERYAAQFGNFTRDHLAELCTPALQAAGGNAAERIFSDILAGSTAPDGDWLNRLLDIDTHTYLVDDIFTKVDIASMQNSLEVRCPLIDHELLEFAATLPADAKLKGFRGKHVLRLALADLLPHKTLYRTKRGFGIPQARWLRNELRPLLHDLLLSPRVYERGHLQRPYVERLLDEHDSGKVNHGLRLWNLLVLELWHRTYVDGN